jgi:hypothetical protein
MAQLMEQPKAARADEGTVPEWYYSHEQYLCGTVHLSVRDRVVS